MRLTTNIQICLLGIFIIGAGILLIADKKPALTALMYYTDGELVQTKKLRAGEVRIQLMPPFINGTDGINQGAYSIRITLISNQSLKQPAVVQYMNFNIKNSFCAMQGGDTLACIICERIPGINANEFLYMTSFSKSTIKNNSDNLRICITDTVAGFGTTYFEIKEKALRKLDAIK